MPNLDLTFILFWASAAAGIAVMYYSFVLAREWFRQWHPSGKGIFRRNTVAETSLNGHIASQWTEGRLRLDSVLTLIKSLADLLEKEVKALRRLDHSDPQYEGEVRQKAKDAASRDGGDVRARRSRPRSSARWVA